MKSIDDLKKALIAIMSVALFIPITCVIFLADIELNILSLIFRRKLFEENKQKNLDDHAIMLALDVFVIFVIWMYNIL